VILGNELFRRSCGNVRPARLLCMTAIDSPNWDWRSGAPSLLGRTGGVLLLEGEETLRGFDSGDSEGDVITGMAGVCDNFEGESCTSGDLLNFWDDFRGGGLGGNGDRRFFFFFFSLPLSSPFIVEFDEEEVTDSRSDGRT
jgi:hypothetical protein